MKLNWQKGILFLATVGMECCWLYALLCLLSELTINKVTSVMVILVLYPAAFIINFLIVRLKLAKAGFLAISWLLWAISMLLMVKFQLFADLPLFNSFWLSSSLNSLAELIYSFRAEALILVSTGILWWLGQRLVFREVDYKGMLSTFQFGLVMLVFVFILASGFTVSLDNSVFIIIAFFLFALIGISIAHALEGISWFSGLYRGQWSGILLVSVGFILSVGILISIAITPDLLQVLWKGIKLIWISIWSIILAVIAFIASLLPAQEAAELPAMLETPAAPQVDENIIWKLPEWLLNALRISWSILVLGIIIWALVRVSSDIYGWLHRRLTHPGNAEVKSLKGAFKADILGFLKNLLARLRDLKLLFLSRRRNKTLPVEVATVRQIYRQFLRWAAKSGYSRQIAQTPNEYCHNLVTILPQAGADLSLLTQQYVNARYGILLASESEVEKLRQVWIRLKRIKPKREIARNIAIKEANAK